MISEERARRVKLLGLDVDGVLTDNGIWIAPVNGRDIEFKRFNISDGLGLVLLGFTEIKVAWVSGRHSESTSLRARELRIPTVIQDSAGGKLPAIETLLAQQGLTWEELAFVGDDLADLPVLSRAGLPITVANGCPEARALAVWVTEAEGGHGAVREVVEGLLRARGEWDQAVADYLRGLGDTAA